jgi:hypothetical protein
VKKLPAVSEGDYKNWTAASSHCTQGLWRHRPRSRHAAGNL